MAEAIGDGANDGGNSGGSGGFVGKCRDLCKNYDMWMSVGSVHNKVWREIRSEGGLSEHHFLKF